MSTVVCNCSENVMKAFLLGFCLLLTLAAPACFGSEGEEDTDNKEMGASSSDLDMGDASPDMLEGMSDLGADMRTEDAGVDMAPSLDLSEMPDSGFDMTPEDLGPTYEEVDGPIDEPVSCNETCASVGKVCDGMYMHYILGGVGGIASWSNASRGGLSCDTVPEKVTTDFGGEEGVLEGVTCYCL